MPKENRSYLAHESGSKVPEQPKESKNLLDKFRNKLLVAAALGAEAFMAACGGLRKEDIEAMPETKIEQILKNPEQFVKMQLIKVEGYPISTGRTQEQYLVPIFGTNSKGQTQFKRFDYINQDVDTYDIHTNSDIKGPSLKARAKGSLIYTPYIPQIIGHESQMPPHRHAVAGKLEELGRGEKKHYVFEIQGSIDEESAKSK